MAYAPFHYVLDSSALIAFLTGEEGSLSVAILIEEAQRKQAILHLASINLFEVYYDFLKRGASETEAKEFLDSLYSLPLSIVDVFNRDWLERAAKLKIAFKMSVADSFGLALAQRLNAQLVTSDHHEFDMVEVTGKARFFWIR